MTISNFSNNITKEEIDKLPLKYFKGKIVLIDTLELLAEAIDELKETKYLGFDTETRPSFIKGIKNPYKVALLQLSTKNKAFLIRLNKVGLPKQLANILEDKNIVKIGLAISNDLRMLKQYSNFKEQNFIDLATYSSEYHNIECNSLKKLTAIVLGFKISKSQQLSNWENNELTEAQQRYAATDAWICYEIFKIFSQ